MFELVLGRVLTEAPVSVGAALVRLADSPILVVFDRGTRDEKGTTPLREEEGEEASPCRGDEQHERDEEDVRWKLEKAAGRAVE